MISCKSSPFHPFHASPCPLFPCPPTLWTPKVWIPMYLYIPQPGLLCCLYRQHRGHSCWPWPSWAFLAGIQTAQARFIIWWMPDIRYDSPENDRWESEMAEEFQVWNICAAWFFWDLVYLQILESGRDVYTEQITCMLYVWSRIHMHARCGRRFLCTYIYYPWRDIACSQLGWACMTSSSINMYVCMLCKSFAKVHWSDTYCLCIDVLYMNRQVL